jgi:hypothetical protein
MTTSVSFTTLQGQPISAHGPRRAVAPHDHPG